MRERDDYCWCKGENDGLQLAVCIEFLFVDRWIEFGGMASRCIVSLPFDSVLDILAFFLWVCKDREMKGTN